MNTVDFEQLKPYAPRTFVPRDMDFHDPDAAVSLFQQLLNREVNSAQEFEQWLKDGSELSAAFDQFGSILYIRMTCHTDNAHYSDEYQAFIQSVLPAVKPLGDEINRKYLSLNERFPLDPNRYWVMERSLKADIELYRSENIPLESDLQMLSQQYQNIFGSMTVSFQGQDYTLPQMGKFQYETDRELREASWRASVERRQAEAGQLETLFEKMFALRVQVARNAGFDNFRDYQFKAYHRFDYSPDHCRRYHQTVEKLVVPLWRRILERRKERMGLDHLRPWDLNVDPQGRPPLRPFEQTEDLISGVGNIMGRLDADLAGYFQEMSGLGLLDLESRKAKAPGGYQSALAESRKPFIFMNAVGLDDDVRTLMHESGHAFHVFAAADEPIYAYRHAPMEFCEVASMSMELLGGEHLDVFYDQDEKVRSIRTHLENVVHILAWVATVDAFQQWMYEHSAHTRAERTAKWNELYSQFDGGVTDWSGLENYRDNLWHRQLHVFEVPFYYIEYGIAQLGALQLWLNASEDLPETLQRYKSALALGGSRPLPELFATAGLDFDFSERTIEPLILRVAQKLDLA